MTTLERVNMFRRLATSGGTVNTRSRLVNTELLPEAVLSVQGLQGLPGPIGCLQAPGIESEPQLLLDRLGVRPYESDFGMDAGRAASGDLQLPQGALVVPLGCCRRKVVRALREVRPRDCRSHVRPREADLKLVERARWSGCKSSSPALVGSWRKLGVSCDKAVEVNKPEVQGRNHGCSQVGPHPLRGSLVEWT